MKIDIIDDEVIIYLYNYNKVDFKDEKCIEFFLKKLFIKLYNFYNMRIEGYYDVNIFLDDYYGVVLNLRKEDIDYYFYKEVDMKIRLNHVKFLYLVDNYDYDKNKFDFIIYLNNVYLLPKIKLEKGEMASLMEFSNVIYDTDEIINSGRVVNIYN